MNAILDRIPFFGNSDTRSPSGLGPKVQGIPVDVAIEYVGHKWVISVRNPGQKEWVAHRSATTKVAQYNHLGEEIKRVPVVEAFASRKAADEFLGQNMPNHRVVQRSAKEIEVFFTALRNAIL